MFKDLSSSLVDDKEKDVEQAFTEKNAEKRKEANSLEEIHPSQSKLSEQVSSSSKAPLDLMLSLLQTFQATNLQEEQQSLVQQTTPMLPNAKLSLAYPFPVMRTRHIASSSSSLSSISNSHNLHS